MNQTRKIKVVALALFIMSYFNILAQQSFYVSPDGNDSWSGTIEKPFKTIQKAQEEVQGINKNLKSEIVVYLRGGRYQLNEGLMFTNEDSGSGDYNVVYKNYEEEQPLISGGVKLTDWVPYENGIYKTGSKGLEFRQLYVNGERSVRARTPDAGDFNHLKAWDVKDRTVMIDAGELPDCNKMNEVEMVIQMFWAESHLHIASVEKSGTKTGVDAYLSFPKEQADIIFPRPYPQKHNDQAYHLENALEFLDAPGEWYLDKEAETVYYKPRCYENLSSAEVIVPVVETLLKIEGTLDEPVKNMRFEGITFEHSTWMYPSYHGYINGQGGQYNIKADVDNNQYVDRPASGILLIAAQDVVFNDNVFRHMGATGIDLFYGTKNCSITGNVLTDISGNGISVGKFTETPETEFHVPYNPKDKREICRGDLIENNFVYKTGVEYFGCAGIIGGYPAELKIRHNTIEDNPYTGISVGYGWTHEPNAMHDNLIENNRIFNVSNLLCDGGGIYTLSKQPGTKITGNYIYGMKRSPWSGAWPIGAIYTDEASGGTPEKPMVVSRNIIPIKTMRQYGILEYNIHVCGHILFSYNTRYKSTGDERYATQEEMEQKGVMKQYRKIIDECYDMYKSCP